jgi:hypothetical protein
MWPHVVVFVVPFVDFLLSILEADEQVKIEALVSKTAIETFDEGVVRRFSRS